MTPAPPAPSRRQLLLEPGATLNGIDFVNVTASQTQLFVHFLNTVTIYDPEHPVQVTITGGETVTAIALQPADETTAWSADSEGRKILALTVAAPGDFSTYRLTVVSDKLDPFFNSAPFTFKANCVTTLDCAAPAASCPEPAAEQVPSVQFVVAMESPGEPAEPSGGALPVHGWDAALAIGAARPDDTAERVADLSPEDVACIIYTSGTGGVPKGVLLTHRNIIGNCRGAYRLLEILGLGEEDHEIGQAMADLRGAGCDLLTITQYLRPSARHHPVARWVPPAEFEHWREEALSLGFAGVMSGPLVRSSYRAGRLYAEALARRDAQFPAPVSP